MQGIKISSVVIILARACAPPAQRQWRRRRRPPVVLLPDSCGRALGPGCTCSREQSLSGLFLGLTTNSFPVQLEPIFVYTAVNLRDWIARRFFYDVSAAPRPPPHATLSGLFGARRAWNFRIFLDSLLPIYAHSASRYFACLVTLVPPSFLCWLQQSFDQI